MRRLVIGDIQGCYAELQALLDKAALSSGDEIISVGDMVDRGPDSPSVLEFFRSRSFARSVMGNHERKHVRWFEGLIDPALSQRIARRQFGEERYPEAIAYMKSLPFYLDLPEALILHGFWEPGVPLSQQRDEVIVGVMSGEQYIKERYPWPWWEQYDGVKPLIVGHHDYSAKGAPLVYKDRVFGIDTGCCYGRALTGLILPEFELISVPAMMNHWARVKQQNAGLRFLDVPDEQLTWESLAELLNENEPVPPERILRLRELHADAQIALEKIYGHVTKKNEELLKQLRRQYAFDQLSPEEQGRLYAAELDETPFNSLMHEARKGKLTPQELRRRFKHPTGLIAFAARIGL